MVDWRDGLVGAFPIPIDKLTLHDTVEIDLTPTKEEALVPHPQGSPFPFFSLPSELRNRIYYLVLFSKPPYHQPGRIQLASRTSVLQASSRLHDEAAYVFYTSHTFRLFPLQEFTPLPTVLELPPRYRKLVTNVEMMLGPSWTDPPKSWKVSKAMAKCLAGMETVHTLRIFVAIDPSHPVFAKFRISRAFYTDFSGNLLRDILAAMPKLENVQLDGNPSVDMNGPLLSRLRSEIEAQKRTIKWGKERGWAATWFDDK